MTLDRALELIVDGDENAMYFIGCIDGPVSTVAGLLLMS